MSQPIQRIINAITAGNDYKEQELVSLLLAIHCLQVKRSATLPNIEQTLRLAYELKYPNSPSNFTPSID